MPSPIAWLIAPALLLFVLFFVLPFVTLGINSFYDYGRMTGIIEVFTLKNYQRLLLDEYYLGIIGRTFRLSGTVALVTLLVGEAVALSFGLAGEARVLPVLDGLDWHDGSLRLTTTAGDPAVPGC